ncbi:MAG TPA: hypothetical protein PLB05_02965 [Candidatus Omnitrophota bacterium]|nr:hypothetical protein [Candidatus Omnitrophota bacterium]
MVRKKRVQPIDKMVDLFYDTGWDYFKVVLSGWSPDVVGEHRKHVLPFLSF